MLVYIDPPHYCNGYKLFATWMNCDLFNKSIGGHLVSSQSSMTPKLLQ